MSDDFDRLLNDEVGTENPFVSPIDVLNEGLRPFSYWEVRTTKVLRAWQEGSRAAGVPTGFAALDNFVRLTPGELTILAARPGMGKTSLALQMAQAMVTDPYSRERVAIFSAEMSGWSLYMRLACAVAGVNMFDLKTRRASNEDYDRVQRAIESLNDLPILVDDTSNPSPGYIRQELAVMSDVYDLRGMIFDFVELLNEEGNGEQAISQAIKDLKEFAKEFDIPVVAISHLNRDVEKRADKIPQLSDFRYSGMIEQLADVAILMVRPKYYTDRGMNVDMDAYSRLQTAEGPGATNADDPAYLFVAKNRNGREGIAMLAYDAPRTRFYDLARLPLENREGVTLP